MTSGYSLVKRLGSFYAIRTSNNVMASNYFLILQRSLVLSNHILSVHTQNWHWIAREMLLYIAGVPAGNMNQIQRVPRWKYIHGSSVNKTFYGRNCRTNYRSFFNNPRQKLYQRLHIAQSNTENRFVLPLPQLQSSAWFAEIKKS